MYTIQTDTENGLLSFTTESYAYAVWLADRMAEDFGETEVYRSWDSLNDSAEEYGDKQLVYLAVPK